MSAYGNPTLWFCTVALPLSYVAYKGIVPLAVLAVLILLAISGWRWLLENARFNVGLIFAGAAILIALLVAGMIAGTFKANFDKSAGIAGALFLLFALGYAALGTEHTSLGQRANWMAFVTLFTGAAAIAAPFVMTAIGLETTADENASSSFNENTYSNFLAVVGVPIVVLVWRFLSSLLSGVIAISIVLQISALGTMASAVSIALSVMVFAIASKSSQAVLWLFGLVCAIFIAAILAGCIAGETIFSFLLNNQIFSYMGNDISIVHRAYIYDFTNQIICTAPWFGIGVDSILSFPGHDAFLTDINRYLLPRHPHNGWMHIWVAGGIFSLLAVMALMLLGARYATKWQGDRWMRAAFLGGLMGWLFIQQISYSVWASWWIISIAVLICVSIYKPVEFGDVRR